MTENNASYRQKGRAVFLAALMVMSVVAMSAAFVGGASAATNKEDLSEDYYQGQELVVTGFNDSEFVQIRQGTLQDSEQVDIARANDSGVLTYDTSDLEEAPYVLREDSTGNDYGPFVIEQQQFDASFSVSQVEQSNNGTLEITSDNRAENFSVTITGTFNGEALTAEELGAIFENDTSNADEDSIGISNVSDGDSLNANLADSDLGDYEFTVNVDDTTAQSTANVSVVEQAETNIAFDDSTLQDTQGDIAEITFDVNNTDQAYLQIQEDYEVDPYSANISITNIDDQKPVTVKFNTYAAGTGADPSDVVEVENGDLVTSSFEEVANFDGHLPANSYDLTIFEQESDQVRQDAAILTLEEPSVDGASTSIAPGAINESDAEEIVNAQSNFDNVANGDYAIVEVQATGIFGYYDLNGDFNNSEALDVNVETIATDRSGEPRATSEDYSIVTDAENDRVFVVLDASNYHSTSYDDWSVSFNANESYPYYGDEAQSVSSSFTVQDRNASFDVKTDNTYQVTKDGDNAWEVRGSTTVAPGTEVTVTASSNLFLESQTVEVQSNSDGDRYFVATFDNVNDEEVELGHEFTLRGEVSGIDTFETDAVIAEQPEWETAADAEQLEQLLADYDVNSVEELRTLIGALENDSEALATLLEENDADNASDLQNTIDDLNSQVDELESENANLSEQVDQLESENANLSEQVDQLESENANLSADSEALATLLENNDVEDADALQSYIDTLEEKKDSGNNESDDSGSDDSGSDDSGSEDSGSDDGTPGFGVAVAAVALLAAAMLALRRQH